MTICCLTFVRAAHVGESDPLEHAQDPHVVRAVGDTLPDGGIGQPLDPSPLEEGEPRHQEAEQEDDRASLDDRHGQVTVARAARSPGAE